MKTKIRSKGNGWYIFANNYKDDKDFAYVNLYFPKGSEPMFVADAEGKCVLDINVQEAKLTCYKGKVGMTIFKYSLVEDNNKNIEFEQDDLPFYK